MRLKKQDELFVDGKLLPLVEEFYTLQGEGFNTGKPAYFIRIGGCDVCCNWCDVKQSWNPSLHPATPTDEIVAHALKYPARAVVITGGEPLLYNLDYLCSELKRNGVKTFIETSGSSPVSGTWDWICLSPKKKKQPLPGIYPLAHELKMVVEKDLDFEWAEYNRGLVGADCKLFLQPEWSAYEKTVGPIVDYILDHPWWNISLQSHKFMHIP